MVCGAGGADVSILAKKFLVCGALYSSIEAYANIYMKWEDAPICYLASFLLGGRISLLDKQMQSCEESGKINNVSFDMMILQDKRLACQNERV